MIRSARARRLARSIGLLAVGGVGLAAVYVVVGVALGGVLSWTPSTPFFAGPRFFREPGLVGAPSEPPPDLTGRGRMEGTVSMKGAPSVRVALSGRTTNGNEIPPRYLDTTTGAYQFGDDLPCGRYVIAAGDYAPKALTMEPGCTNTQPWTKVVDFP
jgi:hypothetical protein